MPACPLQPIHDLVNSCGPALYNLGLRCLTLPPARYSSGSVGALMHSHPTTFLRLPRRMVMVLEWTTYERPSKSKPWDLDRPPRPAVRGGSLWVRDAQDISEITSTRHGGSVAKWQKEICRYPYNLEGLQALQTNSIKPKDYFADSSREDFRLQAGYLSLPRTQNHSTIPWVK